jgi:diguanylate cyclase (GGDEF)-like protein
MAMKKLRKFLSPLATDSLAPLNLPPVRVGLRAKFNALAVGLIVVTAVATSGFYVVRQWLDEASDLRVHGTAIATTLSTLPASSFEGASAAEIARTFAGLASDKDLAYVGAQDARGRLLALRWYTSEQGAASLSPLPAADQLPTHGATRPADVTIGGQRYLEIIARAAEPPVRIAGSAATPDSASPVYIRVGMRAGKTWQQFRRHASGALLVVGLILVASIAATLIVTRRLVAPMRELMRAARAVGSGKLDVVVPAQSSDELGLLTHAFNHMTQRLAEAQSEVAIYQKTLEQKVAQRTKELEVASAQAHRLAQHDILTGLPNRSLLNQQLGQLLAQARRDGQHVACLFLDFDHFKRINDTLGHEAGDQLLQAFAERLTSAVREADVLARLGGDEFVVILPGLDPAHVTFEIMTVLSRIRESLLAPFRIADQLPTLTCSIGVSMFPIDAQDAGSLIRQADTAMYAAKDAGRNAYRFYTSEMNTRVQARLQLETDMRRAMMDNEFFLVFQPQVDVASRRPCGVEALLRWRDPARGVVAPAEFIPVAEQSGMIQAIGARALRDACRQVMRWHRQQMPIRLSVNLSVQQLQHDRWLSRVTDALAASGLAPQFLDLEITESVIITHPDKAVATLVKLKEMGVGIMIDDFGTGYSSLSYLARLPIKGVKIDQRFVRGLGRVRSDESITQAIIALSHSLGLRVVAEGVETEAQFEFLQRHACDEAQGYLISRPLEAEQLWRWWQQQADEISSPAARTGVAPQ